ncbi:MAG TPA: transglutaminase-like domain-containing protein [Gemmatimonadaceae bacterium]
MRLNARGVLAVVILGAWGAGVAAFARRELTRPAVERLAEVAMRISPGATWFLVEQGGRHVGFASITVDTVPRELQVTQYMVTDDASGVRHLEQTTLRFTRGLMLRGFEAIRAAGSDTIRAAGELAGDSTLSFTGTLDDPGRRGQVSLVEPTFLEPLVPTVVALRDRPRVGNTERISIFDPARGERLTLAVRIAAESLFQVTDSAIASETQGRWLAVHRDTVRAWRLTATAPANAFLDVWVDQLGQVVHARRPDGATLTRTAFELAFENWRAARPERAVAARATANIVSSTLLAVGGSLERPVVDSLRLRLRTALPRATVRRFLPELRSGRDWLLMRPQPPSLRASYTLPLDDARQRALGRYLRPAPRIEADDPAIVRLANRLRGNEADPLVVARAIARWVHDSIVPDPTASEASAAETLARRRGDANEVARLTVALARAAGIPTRPVAGLLWADGRFYYHGWAEVHLARFVPIDPMLDQVPADAAHVPMLSNGIDARAELMRLLGQLDLEVVGRPRVRENGR